MSSQLLRPIVTTKLLLNAVLASGSVLPADILASTYPTLGSMQQGAVLNDIASGTLAFSAYRCHERDKIAALRFLAVEGSVPAQGTTVVVSIALLPRFYPTHGRSANDSPDGKAITASGAAMARLAKATLTTDSASLLASRSTDPFRGLPLLASPPKALRSFTLAWTRRDSTVMFQDDGFASGALGQINLDLSFTEYILACVESISSGTSVGGVIAGLDIESQ